MNIVNIIPLLLLSLQPNTDTEVCDEICLVQASQNELVDLLTSDPPAEWPEELVEIADDYVSCVIEFIEPKKTDLFIDFNKTDQLFIASYLECEDDRVIFNKLAEELLISNEIFATSVEAQKALGPIRGLLILTAVADYFAPGEYDSAADPYGVSRFPILNEKLPE